MFCSSPRWDRTPLFRMHFAAKNQGFHTKVLNMMHQRFVLKSLSGPNQLGRFGSLCTQPSSTRLPLFHEVTPLRRGYPSSTRLHSSTRLPLFHEVTPLPQAYPSSARLLVQNKGCKANGLQYEPEGAEPTMESSINMVSRNRFSCTPRTTLTRRK